jgi:hypothetical protein
MMLQRLGKLIVDFWIVIAFGILVGLASPHAHAGLVATDEALAQDERVRVKAMLERPELARQLEQMGIRPDEAIGRVDAMADAEVLQLAGRLDAALAGGQMTNEQILLVIIIVLLILLLLYELGEKFGDGALTYFAQLRS